MTGQIYRLYDPRKGAQIENTRYIGFTRKGDGVRLAAHIKRAKTSKDSCHRLNWLRFLLAAGVRPESSVVATVPLEHWENAERFWIAYFTLLGCDLLNATRGGDGQVNMLPETRAKIAKAQTGKKRPPGATEKWRASMQRYWNDPAYCARMAVAWTGRKHTAEEKAKIGRGNKGKIIRPEAEAKRLAGYMAMVARRRRDT